MDSLRSLETDSGGPREEPMETSAFVPAVPATDDRGAAAADQRMFTTGQEEMVGFTRNLPLLGRFNSDGNCLYEMNEDDSRVLLDMSKNFNERVYYDVKEPVGYGLLVGCRGLSSENPLSDAVFKDVQTMDRALKRTGKWETKCLDSENLTRIDLYEALNNVLLVNELEKYSVFLFYFSGHGNQYGVLFDDNRTAAYDKIVRRISELEVLKNKPKVLVFDTCRNRTTDVDGKIPRGIQPNVLPPHFLLCFSTMCWSLMDRSEGSFYTLALAHSLRTFGQRYMLYEVVTNAARISREYVKMVLKDQKADQLPMFLSSLDKLLVLSANGVYSSPRRVSGPFEETPLETTVTEPVFKGIGQMVEKDIVHLRDVEVKSEWKSKKQVVDNVRTLGDGISIFVIYAPNPDDLYQPPSSTDVVEQRNKVLMLRLFYDLERHGFHVLSDIHLGDSQPTNWLKWYVSRILQCNFVLMVCSPAFKELFEGPSRVDKVSHDKAKRLHVYANTIYSELEKKSNSRTKFLPIILEDCYEKEECVPALFAAGTVYRVVHEDQPRKFTFDNKERDFEKLVCSLTGINRCDLEKPDIGEIKKVDHPYDLRERELKERKRKRMCQANLLTKEELEDPSVLVGSSTYTSGGAYGRGARQDIASANLPGGFGSGQQMFSTQPMPHPPPSQPRPPEVLNPNYLPARSPDRKIFLWLSGELVRWKFIARALGLSDAEIEIIVVDHQGVGEQRYQMLATWERCYFHECSYQKLGRVLLESASNKHLYPEYVERVKNLEQL